ncbi:MAG: insulinase family protein, partial [Desulfobacterales bacterium]
MTSSLNPVDSNNPGIDSGDSLYGYTVTRIEELKDIAAVYYELKHSKTGARHIHISASDTDNAFGVAFKTVPTDSTGVAHILEHTALCGSGQYPVRDPFFSMIKRSLNTFMNAFTASDWTMYPFSTQNRKDYYNLMSVYLDAAFFPNLDALSFKQEGHRLEMETSDGDSDSQRLLYKGVVYNEMKGAMSSPRDILIHALLRCLYPSTTYSHNSGGDPTAIPALTHEQLIAFHRRHYHPSNAYFYTYGNLPLKDHLQSISESILSRFEPIDPKTDVPSQPRWDKPKVERAFYPLEKEEDSGKKCQVCVAWLTADIKDSFETLALALLEGILLSNPASPLRKALIDSGLGAALSDGSGFDADNRDTLFACGLKDVAESSAPEIETIIFDTLRGLAEGGIDKGLIESAIHQIEFHRKEITHTPYPYGLKLLLGISGTWLHGGDPVSVLQLDADFAALREELSKGPFFEDRIKRYFLDNSHRVLFTLVPDPTMAQKENDRESGQLDGILTGLSDSDTERIISNAKALGE